MVSSKFISCCKQCLKLGPSRRRRNQRIIEVLDVVLHTMWVHTMWVQCIHSQSTWLSIYPLSESTLYKFIDKPVHDLSTSAIYLFIRTIFSHYCSWLRNIIFNFEFVWNWNISNHEQWDNFLDYNVCYQYTAVQCFTCF